MIAVFSEASMTGVKEGLKLSSEVLIPSMFVFMILSTFVVRSSISARVGKMLEPVMRRIFKLPGCTGITIILGLVGGYPTGARGISDLVENGQISKRQARRMSYFLVGAGPAFVINVVGIGLMGNVQVGIMLFFSQIFCSLIMGTVLGSLEKNQFEENINKTAKKNTVMDFSTALVESCEESTIGIIKMCGFVVLFSAVINMLNESGFSILFANFLTNLGCPTKISNSVLLVIMEVTGACVKMSEVNCSALTISFVLGWAGLCVHFQIYSILKNICLDKVKFVLFRIIHGAGSALCTWIGLKMFPQSANVISTVTTSVNAGFSTHTQGSIALLFLCTCFLFSLTTQEETKI